MNCTYGCPQEDINSLCVKCGHRKKDHTAIHPHICTGELTHDGVTPVKSCNCPGFVAKESSNAY